MGLQHTLCRPLQAKVWRTRQLRHLLIFVSHKPWSGSKSSECLFDLVIRKDWENLAPSAISKLDEWGAKVQVEKRVVDILKENGVEPDTIESIIWSHLHWDHTGDPVHFPSTVRLIFGPGIHAKFMPGWPEVPKAEFKEVDLEGRKVVGLEKDDFNITVGGFQGLDYFGDGSFFIFDAPSHSLGHLNALARTTSEPETYIFLAADSVHLGGEIRPSPLTPLPDQLDVPGIQPRPCPAERLVDIDPRHSNTLPYLGLDTCFPEHLQEVEHTIELIQKFDADDRAFVIFTHDTSIYGTVELFPRTANHWKAKGWKTAGFWKFLPQLQQIALSNSDR